MTQPKAKWSKYEDDLRVWTATVGCWYLEVDGATGRCELAEWDAESADIGETLWEHHKPVPCDVVELMRLTEDGLSRRLLSAATTLDGSQLVAEHVAGRDCSTCERCGEHHHLNGAISVCPSCWKAALAALIHESSKSAHDQYQQATKWSSRQNPACSVCGHAPTVTAVTEPGFVPKVSVAYQCGHSSDERTRGSRAWATALMARGNSVTDYKDHELVQSEIGRGWLVFGTDIAAEMADELPALGWYMAPL